MPCDLIGIGKVSVILPITDEVFLVEDGAVWTKERICKETAVHVSQGAHVESLVIQDDFFNWPPFAQCQNQKRTTSQHYAR